MTDLKLCANCNELKSLDEYHKHIRKPIKNRTFIKNNKDRLKKRVLSEFIQRNPNYKNIKRNHYNTHCFLKFN